MEQLLRTVEYKDAEGRLSRRLIPWESPDEEAEVGVVVGPPPLDSLQLPSMVEIHLNNELYHRGLLTIDDIRRRKQDVAAAIMSAVKLDVQTLIYSLSQLEVGSNAKSR